MLRSCYCFINFSTNEIFRTELWMTSSAQLGDGSLLCAFVCAWSEKWGGGTTGHFDQRNSPSTDNTVLKIDRSSKTTCSLHEGLGLYWGLISTEHSSLEVQGEGTCLVSCYLISISLFARKSNEVRHNSTNHSSSWPNLILSSALRVSKVCDVIIHQHNWLQVYFIHN